MLIGSMKTNPFKPTHLNIFDLNEFDENQPNQGVTMLSNVHFNLFISTHLNNFDVDWFDENQTI